MADTDDRVACGKKWMLGVVERYRFWGVLLFSSWPNALFDLTGLCCGHLLMPLRTFLSAVIIGKALIKVNGQLLFFLLLFANKYRHGLVDVLARGVGVFGADVDAMKSSLHDMVHKFSIGNGHDDGDRSSVPSFWAGVFHYGVLVLVLFFIKSCIEQLAQAKQKELDSVLK